MATTVDVRPAEPDDAARLLEWRNDRDAVTSSLTGAAVEPGEHARWFERVLRDPDRVLLIGVSEGSPIGMCRFDIDGDSAEVSINLDPVRRGQGLAVPLLSAGIEALHDRAANVKRLTAQVRAGNSASVRLFTRAGFAPRDGEAEILRFERSTISGTDPS